MHKTVIFIGFCLLAPFLVVIALLEYRKNV